MSNIETNMKIRGFSELLYFGLLSLSFSSRSCPDEFEECKTCDVTTDVGVDIRSCGRFEEIANESFATLEEATVRLLSRNREVKRLTLSELPLRTLNGSVCFLVALEDLSMSENHLESIPAGCFKGFDSIRNIRIVDNKLKRLRKGLFDGLRNLEEIDLSRNEIEVIDEEVFMNKSDLLKLKRINFEGNRLTSVGAWIFIRPLASLYTTVNLKRNLISRFTNSYNWSFQCEDRPNASLVMVIDLTHNKVEHMTDVVRPYLGMNLKLNLFCLFSAGKRSGGDFNILLRSNPLICDCVDVDLILLAQGAPYSSILDDVQCGRPIQFQDRKVLSIQPDQLVCRSRDDCVPGCECIRQPSTHTFHVDCSNSYAADSLPIQLPKVPFKHLRLLFNGNRIARLDERSYFAKTNFLDLSKSGIKLLSAEFLTSVKEVQTIYLHGNELSTLPREACLTLTFGIANLTLYDNPWNCSCENRWMKSWLNASRGMVKLPGSMHCREPRWLRGKSILTIDDLDFCRDPAEAERARILTAVLVPLFGSIALAAGTFLLVRRFKVEMHARFSIHPFDRDECEGELMLYDAFISSSHKDRTFAIELLRTLESKNYRICFHEKDFPIGSTIASNICRAIVHSKRVVCLLSRDFLESAYCMYEFQTALHRNIETKRKRLIAVICDPAVLLSKDVMSEDMNEFLATHTYVEVKESNGWLDQLCYSLPIKKIEEGANRHRSLLGTSESELVPSENGNVYRPSEPQAMAVLADYLH